MEAVREESGGDDSKRLRKRMVETLPRDPKSSRSCFVGSASASAGKFSTLWNGPEWLKEEESN